MEGASFFYGFVMGSFFIARKRIQAPYGTPDPPPLRKGNNPLGGARILHEQCSQNVS